MKLQITFQNKMISQDSQVSMSMKYMRKPIPFQTWAIFFYKKEKGHNAEPKVQWVMPKATWNHSQEAELCSNQGVANMRAITFQKKSVDKWLWRHNVKGVKVICKMEGKLLWPEANYARFYLAITSPVLMALPILHVLPFPYTTLNLPHQQTISLLSPTYEWKVWLLWQTEYSRHEGILWSSMHSLVCWKHLLLVCLCLGHNSLGPSRLIITENTLRPAGIKKHNSWGNALENKTSHLTDKPRSTKEPHLHKEKEATEVWGTLSAMENQNNL